MVDEGRAPDAGDDAALRVAERVLAVSFGGSPRLALLASLVASSWRNRVLRCRVLDGPDGLPGTVVVKQPRAGYDPDRADWPAVGLLNEWAGLQFLGRLVDTPPPAPRLHGGDRGAGVIVLEDLTPFDPVATGDDIDGEIARFKSVIGDAETVLFALLRRDRGRGERLLLDYAAGLGRMHAATAGRELEYGQLRAALGPDGPRPARWLERALPQIRNDLARLGIAPGGAFDGEVGAIAAALDDPGPFLVYTHGDPCPGNDIVIGERVRMIDFELGGFGHALRDAVYPHVFFPTCGSAGALPDAFVAAMEAAYRRELVAGVPTAADDRRFDHAVAQLCAYWTVQTLGGGYGQVSLGQALTEDTTWGRATMRARIVTRVRRFLTIPRARGATPALTETLARLSDRLDQVWPNAGAIPLYTAFR